MDKEVNPLNSKYIELTARYKACWTFHRFIVGLQKFFGQREIRSFPFDFQSLYKKLRAASVSLNTAPETVEGELAEIEEELGKFMDVLDQQDGSVSPSQIRLFFTRVKNWDERLLIEMIRFYQETQRGRSWTPDRIDKADFLVSRLAESVAGPDLQGDRGRLERILGRLSANVELEDVDSGKTENRRKLIESVRSEIRRVRQFEELTDKDLVGHYRRAKHGLGRLFFEGSILALVMETNALLSERIQELSKLEEKRIFDDYERISRLEREGTVDTSVVEAVNELHSEVGRFKKVLKAGGFRLADLTRLKKALERLSPLLEPEDAAEAPRPPAAVEAALPARPPSGVGPSAFVMPSLFSWREAQDLVGSDLEDLFSSLSAAEPTAGPAAVATSAPLISFRLEPREVVAFRRLAAGAEADDRLEGFLIGAAALRRRINREVDEIHAQVSRSGTASGAVADSARRTAAVADWYLRQFEHFTETAALDGETDEVRDLQVLKMRLTRDYSGLWLVLYRKT